MIVGELMIASAVLILFGSMVYGGGCKMVGTDGVVVVAVVSIGFSILYCKYYRLLFLKPNIIVYEVCVVCE